MAGDRNNTNFKRIKIALSLNDDDIVKIMRYVDVEISKSKAHAWSLGKHATKTIDNIERKKMIKMTNFEFDMFCKGLLYFK